MAKNDWKQVVATVAPTLASAFGSPLLGAALKLLGDKLLGRPDASEADIAAAVGTASPDVLLKVKQADADFQKFLESAGIERERIAAADRASAREREKATGDVWTPRILAGVVVAGFFASVGYVLAGKVQLSGEAGVLIGSLIGYVSAKADLVVAYYFGSSSGSKNKDAVIAALGQK